MDKVSIIVPVYNEKTEYLEKCMKSIAGQTYSSIEIIIVDDGSNTDTAELCDSFAKSFNNVIVFHKQNEGVSVARNFGISKSTGTWITFVDSDDWLEVNAIENLIKCNNESKLIISRYYSDNEKRVDDEEYNKLYKSEEIFVAMFYQKRFMSAILESCWAKLYSKDIITQHNIQFPKGVKRSEDMLFNIEFLKYIDSIYVCDSYTYHYRVNELSVTRKYDKKYLETNELLLETTLNRFKRDYTDKMDCYYYMSIRFLQLACKKYIFSGKSDLEFNKRITIFKEEVNKEIYACAIKKIRISKLGIGRKALVIIARMKLYILLGVLFHSQLKAK